MLLPLYPDPKIREQILEDPQTAPIPDVQKEMFRFAERFVRGSWEMGPADLERLRAVGLSEADIVSWATLGSTQTWFTMSADGGGIPMEGDALSGPGVGLTREHYEASAEGLLAPALGAGPRATAPETHGASWAGTDLEAPGYLEAARWAEERYGFVPNLLGAVSLQPNYFRRHQLALELLERPQSEKLEPRHHAMVRALVSQLTRCAYSQTSTRALLARSCGDEAWDRIAHAGADPSTDPVERVVLDFAAKVARHAYKVTDKDVQSFREAGLDDAAYVDVLNTTSIQVSLDRLANSLGVRPDGEPMLGK